MQFITLVTFFFATFATANPLVLEALLAPQAYGEGGNDVVYPTDIYGYEDPEEFIQDYYEYKKGCTNDCQPGLVRNVVYNAADLV